MTRLIQILNLYIAPSIYCYASLPFEQRGHRFELMTSDIYSKLNVTIESMNTNGNDY